MKKKNGKTEKPPSPRECKCSQVFTLAVPSHNFTLNYLYFYKFRPPVNYVNVPDQFNILNYPLFEKYLPLSHTMLFNIGVHEDGISLNEFSYVARYAAQSMAEDQQRSRGQRAHAWYLTEPVHFEGRFGEFFQRRATKCMPHAARHYTASMAMELVLEYVPVIDPTPLLMHRGEMHSAINRNDCTHWCFAQEMYLPRWALIADFVNRQHNQKRRGIKAHSHSH